MSARIDVSTVELTDAERFSSSMSKRLRMTNRILYPLLMVMAVVSFTALIIHTAPYFRL